jgi:adenylate cyclase class 2
MKEVEILVEVKESKRSALDKLMLSKIEDRGIQTISDIYYYDPMKKDLSIDPTSDRLIDNTFRLRSKNGKSLLTFKVKRFDDSGKWLYSDEYETEVSDHETAQKIIECLGLKPLVKIENERHVFVNDRYEIVLEDVKGLGLFLEVEAFGVEDDADADKINQEISAFIQSLGVDVGEDADLGKPELMLKKSLAENK